MRRYVWNVLISIDQLANTLLGGDPDETLSSRMGKAIAAGRCKLCRPVCWLLHLLDKNHCHNSIDPQEGADEVIKF
jgi:hypothetical protein